MDEKERVKGTVHVANGVNVQLYQGGELVADLAPKDLEGQSEVLLYALVMAQLQIAQKLDTISLGISALAQAQVALLERIPDRGTMPDVDEMMEKVQRRVADLMARAGGARGTGMPSIFPQPGEKG